MRKKSEKNYWPHAIVTSLILIALACVATVYIALKSAPVELDTFYFDAHENIDKNINEIKAKQRAFEDRYDIYFDELNALNVSKENKISLKIIDKSTQKFLKNAKIQTLLTRPETNRFNQEIPVEEKEDEYILSTIDIQKAGRWFIQVKIETKESVGFFTKEVYVAN